MGRKITTALLDSLEWTDHNTLDSFTHVRWDVPLLPLDH